MVYAPLPQILRRAVVCKQETCLSVLQEFRSFTRGQHLLLAETRFRPGFRPASHKLESAQKFRNEMNWLQRPKGQGQMFCTEAASSSQESSAANSLIPRVSIADYSYELPPERIAQYPLPLRDHARLFVFDPQQGMQHRFFYDLPSLLPPESVLVGNDSRVIAARLLLRRAPPQTDTSPQAPCAARLVEVLCLEPIVPSTDPAVVLSCREPPVEWACWIGGRRVFPGLELRGEHLRARILERAGQEGTVRFDWEPTTACLSFGELLEREGRTPLPPYLNRDDTPRDRSDYQTVFARESGSVAAPTAGLHFSEELIKKHFEKRFIRFTLHVGAGTFAPVKAADIGDHIMHRERIIVRREQLVQLIRAVESASPLVAVGTTTVRILESLYWYGSALCRPGAKRAHRGAAPAFDEHLSFVVEQWDPYVRSGDVPVEHALSAVLDVLERNRASEIHGYTSLIIVPGYSFRVVDALITNFHQPRSTLLLLVAAFLPGGRETLFRIYHEALARSYRFLSYGDASLLWRKSVQGR